MRAKDFLTEKWSAKYKRSINCNNPKGFSQRAHCQGRKKTKEEVEEAKTGSESTYWRVEQSEATGRYYVVTGYQKRKVWTSKLGAVDFISKDAAQKKADDLNHQESLEEEHLDELKCWSGYTRVKGIPAGAPGSCKKKTNETDDRTEEIEEDLRKWFKEKWVRFNPQGKIMGPCARGSSKEGKPKCLPQSKAQSLGKKGRASAAARKRRQDPNPERKGSAKNVATKKK